LETKVAATSADVFLGFGAASVVANGEARMAAEEAGMVVSMEAAANARARVMTIAVELVVDRAERVMEAS
jgi:hypothetical protein